jgi:hypothetical protein
MSRENNMMLRAVIGVTGSISEFDLSNYSGGGNFRLRLQPLNGYLYWVLEGNGYDRTLLYSMAHDGSWDSSDLDELGMEVLKLHRAGTDLEGRDARLRARIEARTGEILPLILPRVYESALGNQVGNADASRGSQLQSYLRRIIGFFAYKSRDGHAEQPDGFLHRKEAPQQFDCHAVQLTTAVNRGGDGCPP